MYDMLKITDFLDPLDIHRISNDESYKEGQVGKVIDVYENEFPDIGQADLILIGCNEERGNIGRRKSAHAPDAIRQQFYQLFYWHPDVRLADIGNIKQGATLNDTYAALKTIIKELIDIGKTVIILGGS